MQRQLCSWLPDMFVNDLNQYRISLWPKTAGKRGFCTGVMVGHAVRRTDQRTDRRMDERTNPLIEMRSGRTLLKTLDIFIAMVTFWHMQIDKPPKPTDDVLSLFDIIVIDGMVNHVFDKLVINSSHIVE